MIPRLQKQIKELPQKPGVYFLKNNKEEVLYIGKAINIKKRVQTHFTNGHSFAKFYPQVRSVDYITVRTEKDALVLENQLIKKLQPKYNVDWKDDKNYSFVAFTREPLPRVFITHQPKNFRDSVSEIIGPFVSGYELRKFLFEIRKLFPYRTCKNKPEKPCLYHHMGLCWAHGPEAKKYPLVLKGLRALLRLYNGEKVRTECYDISNTQGSLSVGSMVSFKGSRPDKSMYRKFKIKTVAGSDDPRSMLEIITRRLNHPEWAYPDLIVLDGGRSQLSKLKNLPVPTIALAKLNREKRTATIFSPYGKAGIPLSVFPVEISQPLLALRDESHRFAITYHRLRRIKDIKI
jgi:excinuclease UvrABC nuclease subunit